MNMISSEKIDAGAVIQSVTGPEIGAVVPFLGAVRNDKGIAGLFYESHPEMAERVMQRICKEAIRRWPDGKIAVVHRVGWIPVGEESVVIAASAPHRKEAFEACRFVIEAIKKDVPIWKRESATCHCERKRPPKNKAGPPCSVAESNLVGAPSAPTGLPRSPSMGSGLLAMTNREP